MKILRYLLPFTAAATAFAVVVILVMLPCNVAVSLKGIECKIRSALWRKEQKLYQTMMI